MNLTCLTHHIDFIKKPVCEVLDAHCESGLYTLKFHLLYHFVEGMESSGTLQLLDSSALDRYRVHIKSAYGSKSERHSSGIEENEMKMERCSKSENGGGRPNVAKTHLQ